MACCAFAAFIIGQCFALFDGWRRRLRRLLGLPIVEPSLSMNAPEPPPRRVFRHWRGVAGLMLVVELGFVFGWAAVAVARDAPGLLPPSIAAWCSLQNTAAR
ncbi:MAG: hypothetical protein ISP90_12465 [Nevskia sp.]|nr:hypothetical protein [Nevskia sp.]